MATKAEIDAEFLVKHNALTAGFYQQKKKGGGVTRREQDLFDKAHRLLVCTHEAALIADKHIEDRHIAFIHEGTGDKPGDIIGIADPPVKRSTELAGIKAASALSVAEATEIQTKWNADLSVVSSG